MKTSLKQKVDLSSSSDKERSTRFPKSRESGYYDQTSGSSIKNVGKIGSPDNDRNNSLSLDSSSKKKQEKENQSTSILKKGKDKSQNISNRVLTFRDTNMGYSPNNEKLPERYKVFDGYAKASTKKESESKLFEKKTNSIEKPSFTRKESPSEEEKRSIRQKQLEKEKEIFNRIVIRSKDNKLVNDTNDSYVANKSRNFKKSFENYSEEEENPHSKANFKARDEFSDLERRINRLELEIDSNLKRKECLNKYFQNGEKELDKRGMRDSDHSIEIDKKINKIKQELELESSSREKASDFERRHNQSKPKPVSGKRTAHLTRNDGDSDYYEERKPQLVKRYSSEESFEREASEIKKKYKEESLEKLKRKSSKAKRELEEFRKEQEKKKTKDEWEDRKSKRVKELSMERVRPPKTNPIVDESIKILKENEILKQKIRDLERKEQQSIHTQNNKERATSSGKKLNIPRPRSKTPEIRPSTSNNNTRAKSSENIRKNEEEELEKILILDKMLKEIVRDGDTAKLEKEIELLKTIERIKRKLRRAIAMKINQNSIKEKNLKRNEKKIEDIKKIRKTKPSSGSFKSSADQEVPRNPGGSKHCSNCAYLLSKGVPTNFCTNHNTSHISGF